MAFLVQSVKKLISVFSRQPDVVDIAPVVSPNQFVTPQGRVLPVDNLEGNRLAGVARRMEFNDDEYYLPPPVPAYNRIEAKPRREKEPAKYNGKSDFTDYKAQFEFVAAWNKWSSDEMGLQLAMSLTDEAREVLTSVIGEPTYEELVGSLECRYSPRGRESQYGLELMSRDQGLEEDVSTYGHVIRRLATKAYGAKGVDDMILVNTFLRGLRDVNMKRHVYNQKPESLEEAIHIAVAYDAFDKPICEHSRKPRVTVAPVQGRNNVKVNTVNEQATTGNAEQLRELIREMMVERRSESVRCYACQELGHIARNCPTRQQGSRSRGPNQYARTGGNANQFSGPSSNSGGSANQFSRPSGNAGGSANQFSRPSGNAEGSARPSNY